MSSTYDSGGPTTMAEFQIERDVLIDAPVEVVWRTITEPEQIRHWFADRVELELEPGGRGLMTFDDRAYPLVVEALEPPIYFSFRWHHPTGETPSAGNSTLVEFTLVSEGKRTRLRVIESGLELLTWPVDDKQRFADDHREGWATYLERLARLLAERPSE